MSQGVSREMKEGDLVLKQVVEPTMIDNIFLNWIGS